MKHALLAAGVAAAGFTFTSDITIGIFGVPLNVLLACGIGAFCSIVASDKLPRGKMASTFILGVFMGAAFTGTVQAAVEYFTNMVVTPAFLASMGIIVSFLTRFVLPSIVDSAKTGSWRQYVPFLNRVHDKEEGEK